MIRFNDATTLAFTKLRTRKVRLFITVIISGLLFSALAGASIVMRGGFASINDFSKEGFGKRYITTARVQSSVDDLPANPDAIARALVIQKDLVARKKAEAKRLDIPYDSATEVPALNEYDTPTGKQKALNMQSYAAKQAVKEYAEAHPTPGIKELKKLADPYQPSGYFESQRLAFSDSAPSVQILKDGKEAYDIMTVQQNNGPATGLDSFVQSWSLMNQGLLTPFILPGSTMVTGKDGSLPVIAPYSAVEQLLKLKALPSTAKPSEKLARLKEVRAKAQSITFQVCYRNNTSEGLINRAIGAQTELVQNKNNKDYQKPSLIYGLPDKACGPVTIARDVRTKEEKDLAAKQLQFNQTFGELTPQQSVLNFRVIGIVSDPPGFNASGLSIISSLVTSSLESGWYTPLELKPMHPEFNDIFTNNTVNASFSNGYFVEFASANQARKFIDKASCSPDFSGAPANGSNTVGIDPLANCQKEGKNFFISPYGSNSLALESIKRDFGKFFSIAALIVAAIACVIMIGTVGRMIADSRRETAVFRAIGAKKMDISQIYIIYAIFLSIFISIFALTLGFLLAGLANARWSQDITIQALVAYNAQDLTKTFTLYNLYLPDMVYLVGLALAGGLVSAIFPLLRNLRRNPIRDMRDDT